MTPEERDDWVCEVDALLDRSDADLFRLTCEFRTMALMLAVYFAGSAARRHAATPTTTREIASRLLVGLDGPDAWQIVTERMGQRGALMRLDSDA